VSALSDLLPPVDPALVDAAIATVARWVRGGESLVNRQDVAVILASEVVRMRGASPPGDPGQSRRIVRSTPWP